METLHAQIHIAGTVRTGKSTLARNLAIELSKRGFRTSVLDVDFIRTSTFGSDEPILGNIDPERSPEDRAKYDLQKKMQGWTYDNIFNVQIPLISELGGIPIFAATHAAKTAYPKVRALAERLGNRLCFILLEETDFEEMARRCTTDSESRSDMAGDPRTNAALADNWRKITERVHAAYDDLPYPILRIPQGTPAEMTRRALEYILNP